MCFIFMVGHAWLYTIVDQSDPPGNSTAPVVEHSYLPEVGTESYNERRVYYIVPWLRGQFCLRDGVLYADPVCGWQLGSGAIYWTLLAFVAQVVLVCGCVGGCVVGCICHAKMRSAAAPPPPPAADPPVTCETMPQDAMFPTVPPAASDKGEP
jgi:hypothetical protein